MRTAALSSLPALRLNSLPLPAHPLPAIPSTLPHSARYPRRFLQSPLGSREWMRPLVVGFVGIPTWEFLGVDGVGAMMVFEFCVGRGVLWLMLARYLCSRRAIWLISAGLEDLSLMGA